MRSRAVVEEAVALTATVLLTGTIAIWATVLGLGF
jgi:hypothetical protein